MPRKLLSCCVKVAVIRVEALFVDTFIAKLIGTDPQEAVPYDVSSYVHDNTKITFSIARKKTFVSLLQIMSSHVPFPFINRSYHYSTDSKNAHHPLYIRIIGASFLPVKCYTYTHFSTHGLQTAVCLQLRLHHLDLSSLQWLFHIQHRLGH